MGTSPSVMETTTLVISPPRSSERHNENIIGDGTHICNGGRNNGATIASLDEGGGGVGVASRTTVTRKRKRLELDAAALARNKRRRRNNPTWERFFSPPPSTQDQKRTRQKTIWSARNRSSFSRLRALSARFGREVVVPPCRFPVHVEGTLIHSETVTGAVHSVAFAHPSTTTTKFCQSLELEDPQVKAVCLRQGGVTALVSLAGVGRNVFSIVPNLVVPSIVATTCDDQHNFLRMHWDAAASCNVSLPGAPGAARTCATTVRTVTWHPDGIHFAAGRGDGRIHIWNTLSNRLIATLSGRHGGHITSLSYHPKHGDFLVSGCFHGRIYIWDTHSFQVVRTLRLPTSLSWVWSVSYSPTGALIASDVDSCSIRLWNSENGTKWRDLKGHLHHVTSLAWSPCTTPLLLVSGSLDRTVRVWNVAKGKCVWTWGDFSRVVRAVAWSSDNDYIAAGSNDCTIMIWKIRTVVS